MVSGFVSEEVEAVEADAIPVVLSFEAATSTILTNLGNVKVVSKKKVGISLMSLTKKLKTRMSCVELSCPPSEDPTHIEIRSSLRG